MPDENLILELARRGIVSHTFRRLSPEKKSRVYETAIKLFGEYGYDGLSVDHLCRAAGISKGSFFQYFSGKSELLEFAIVAFDDRLRQWLAEVKAAEPSALAGQRILHLYRALAVNPQLSRAEQSFYHFVISAARHSAVAIEGIDLERHIHEYVTEIIEQGEQRGEVRGDFDVHLTARLTSLFVVGLVGRLCAGGGMPPEGTDEYLISFLFDGIRA